MTTPNLPSPRPTTQGQGRAREAPATETTTQARTALRAAWLLLGATIVMLPVNLYLAFQTEAWQLFAITGISFVFGIVSFVSMILIRRGRSRVATWLLFGTILAMVSITVALITGVGLVLGAALVLVAAALAGQTLPPKQAGWAIAASVVVGFGMLLLDQFGPDYRLSVPQLQAFLSIVSVVIILVFGYVAARQFRDYAMRTKMLITFVGVAAIAVVGVSFLTLRTMQSAYTKQIGESYIVEVESLGRQVEAFFEAKVSQMVALTLVDTIQEQLEERNQSYAGGSATTLAEIQALDEQWVAAGDDDPLIRSIITPDQAVNPTAYQLADFLKTFPSHTEIFVTDRHGATLGATGRLSDYYQADEDWWQVAWNDGEGAIYISDPEYDESAGVTALLIAVPVFEESGEVIGILRSTLNVEALYTQKIRVVKYGETGHAALFDSSAEVLYESVGEGEGSSAGLLPAERQHLLEREMHYDVATDAGGDQFILAHSPIAMVTDGNARETEAALAAAVTNLGWTVVIRQEAKEAFAPITRLAQDIQLVGAVILVLAGLGALFMARFITQPILGLAAATKAMRAGNLNARAQVESGDEVGVLAASFNQMAEQVSNLLTGLGERTAELEARTREIEASQRVTFAASERTSPDELLNLVVNLIRDQFHLYHVQVYIVDEPLLSPPREQGESKDSPPVLMGGGGGGQAAVLRQSTGYAGRRLLQQDHHIPLDRPALVTKAIREGQPVLVADVSQEPSFLANPLLPNTQSELVVPLKVGDKVIGVLDAQARTPGRFTENTVALFQTMADQVAFLFENSELIERVTEQSETLTIFTTQLRAAADIARQMGSVLDPERLLQQVVDLIRSRFGFYHVHIYMLDATTRQLVVQAGSGEVGRVLRERGHSISLDAKRSLVARTARNQKAVLVEDTSLESDFLPNPLLPQTRSSMSVPLVAGDRVLGVLNIQDDQPGRFTETEMDTFSTLAGQIATALQTAAYFEQVQQTAEQLREMDRLKSEFLANMSHELRTPLNSIIGYTELMLMGVSEIDPDTLEDVRAIYDNGHHLLRLINDILDMARIEAGGLALNFEQVQIEPLIDEVSNNAVALLAEKPIQWIVEVEKDLPPIQGDPLRISQILGNLVTNAEKFTQEGAITLRAYAAGDHGQPEWVCIKVQDTGIGIAETDMDKVFDRFQQVDGSSTRRAGGTGLGLSITRHLVELHGGTIEVRSQPGVGSTFTVRLPAQVQE